MSLREIRLLPRGSEVLMLGVGMLEETVLKARMPSSPGHPRAVIDVLEGLALWSGRRLPVVVGVTASSSRCIEDLLPAGPAWCSPLVELVPVDHPMRRRRPPRLDGVGDFRELLRLRVPGGVG